MAKPNPKTPFAVCTRNHLAKLVAINCGCHLKSFTDMTPQLESIGLKKYCPDRDKKPSFQDDRNMKNTFVTVFMFI